MFGFLRCVPVGCRACSGQAHLRRNRFAVRHSAQQHQTADWWHEHCSARSSALTTHSQPSVLATGDREPSTLLPARRVVANDPYEPRAYRASLSWWFRAFGEATASPLTERNRNEPCRGHLDLVFRPCVHRRSIDTKARQLPRRLTLQDDQITPGLPYIGMFAESSAFDRCRHGVRTTASQRYSEGGSRENLALVAE